MEVSRDASKRAFGLQKQSKKKPSHAQHVDETRGTNAKGERGENQAQRDGVHRGAGQSGEREAFVTKPHNDGARGHDARWSTRVVSSTRVRDAVVVRSARDKRGLDKASAD